MLFPREIILFLLYPWLIIAIQPNGNNSDFQAIYLDARCLATCSTEFSTLKPLEEIIDSSARWPIFHDVYNENIILCYYSCIQCGLEDISRGSVGCATSTFAPCIAGRLYCREDRFFSCIDYKPSIPLQKPSIKFTYTDFNYFEVIWPIHSGTSIYASTDECQSYTTFILRMETFDVSIYYMAFTNSTRIQLFNHLIRSFSFSFNISVGAVNKAGFSGFGPETVFQLSDRDPGPMKNLRYNYSENDNYLNEYKLLLRWELPTSNYENLYSIFLNVLSVGNPPSDSCSSFSLLYTNKTIELSRDTTHYLFEHQEDYVGPISNCYYEFILRSQFAIFNASITKTIIFLPFICHNPSLPFQIRFSFLPFNGEFSFLRIHGSWPPVLNETVLYILQLSILLDNNSGSKINIVKETFDTSIDISSLDIAVEDVFHPPIYINYKINAVLSAHLNCSVISHEGSVILNAVFPTIPLNFNAKYDEFKSSFVVDWEEPSNFGGPLTGYQLLINYTTLGFIKQNSTFNIEKDNTQFIISLRNTTRLSVKMRASNIFGHGLYTQFIHLYLRDQLVTYFPTVTTNIPTSISVIRYSLSKISLLIITPFSTLLIGTILVVFFSCIFLITKRNSGRSRLSQSCSRNSIDKCEIAYSQLLFLPQTLGTGAFGLVKKAILKRSSKLSIVVAVKMTRDDSTDFEINDLSQEICRMKRIGRHPHIVEFLGCVSSDRPICLILEFVPYGDLLTLLRKLRNERDLNTGANYIRWFGLLTLSDFSDFAIQIADGMEFISSLKLVHRDLACRNILVAENKQLKISDFGLAREFDTDYDCNNDKEYYRLHIHNDKLPIRWMALESITEFIFSTKSDVWSYGITLWEIATLGRTPYSAIPNNRFFQFLFSKNRLEVPANCTPEMFEVMRSCWHECPDYRPKFVELKEKFKKILINYEDKRILSIPLSDSDELISADLSGSFHWEIPNQGNIHTSIANSMADQNLEGSLSLISLDPVNNSVEIIDKTQNPENGTCSLEFSPTNSSIPSIERSKMKNETIIVNRNEENEKFLKDVSIELQMTDSFPHKTDKILNKILLHDWSEHFPMGLERSKQESNFMMMPSTKNEQFASSSFDVFDAELDKSLSNTNFQRYTRARRFISTNISEDPETEL